MPMRSCAPVSFSVNRQRSGPGRPASLGARSTAWSSVSTNWAWPACSSPRTRRRGGVPRSLRRCGSSSSTARPSTRPSTYGSWPSCATSRKAGALAPARFSGCWPTGRRRHKPGAATRPTVQWPTPPPRATPSSTSTARAGGSARSPPTWSAAASRSIGRCAAGLARGSWASTTSRAPPNTRHARRRSG